MTLDEKYEVWKDIYLSTFVSEGDGSEQGKNIPLESISNGSGFTGDGTINLSHYITWAWLNGDTERLNNAEKTLKRMSDNAYNLYKDCIPVCKDMIKEEGFFLRDDLPADSYTLYGLNYVQSSYGGNILGINEDVCHSPFVSQDQCWNLLPALKDAGMNEIGKNIFGYVVNNKHVIYNPYISQILHQHTYKDLGVEYNDRIEDRKEHLKYTVKVKRGANNWYFSYGFKKAYKLFGGECSTFWSSLWYKPFIFLADRIYHPIICKWFNIPVKNTSYYAMAISAGAWYMGDPDKRILKKMNKSLKDGELFLPEIFVHSKYASEVDKDLLLDWLDAYPEADGSGNYSSPIIFMIMYSFFKNITK